MTTTTLIPASRTAWPAGLALGSVAGAALVVAGIWNTLIQQHVTVDPPPKGIGPEVPPEQGMHTYYGWYASTVGQERADTILAMVGVTGLVLLAVELRRRLGSDILGRGACTAIHAGGLVWAIGALATIGEHNAVALMATHGNPIQTVNAINFAADMTSDAFSTASFLLLGAAMIAIGIAPVRPDNARWTGLNLLTGAVALIVAVGFIEGVDAITTYVLGLLAAVLLPTWLVLTGRLLDRTETPSG